MSGQGLTSYILAIVLGFAGAATPAAEPPTKAEVTAALQQAVAFFAGGARQGGYLWVYSPDQTLGMGEGTADADTIWVQPPGTPAVALAMLDAYAVTGDPVARQAAVAAARALVAGQLYSGGWYYSVTLHPDRRREFAYRQPPSRGEPSPPTPEPGGWDTWRQRRHKGNMTMMDDETTAAALRLLMRVDALLEFQDSSIHECVEYGLRAVAAAQHPIGAWSHNFDQYPPRPPSPAHYPILSAAVPADWSRTWTKDFTGGYVLNDEITPDAIRLYLEAHKIYRTPEYLAVAQRGGDFLVRAQLPAPQPAWAQQYNRQMQPVWDRAFEPPAIASHESQAVLDTLLDLFERTGDRRYLDAARRGLDYLQSLRLPDGKLARFYELTSNRPLYFTTKYQLTYDATDLPDHYGFVIPSRLEVLGERMRRLQADGGSKEPPLAGPTPDQVRRVLAAMTPAGAWLEPGFVRDPAGKKITPPAGVVRSQTFIDNVTLLVRYLRNLEP